MWARAVVATFGLAVAGCDCTAEGCLNGAVFSASLPARPGLDTLTITFCRGDSCATFSCAPGPEPMSARSYGSAWFGDEFVRATFDGSGRFSLGHEAPKEVLEDGDVYRLEVVNTATSAVLISIHEVAVYSDTGDPDDDGCIDGGCKIVALGPD